MKKPIIITAIVVLVATLFLIVINRMANKEDPSILFAEVKQGVFDIIVTTTGELQAENSTEIRAPESLASKNMRFREIKIQNLIAEGTVVKAGDYVATLDRTEADNTLKDDLDRLDVMLNDRQTKMLDTTLQLGDLRNNLNNLKFNMEEAEIALEQSKYEPPTTIRQNTMNLEKANRTYLQAQKSYELKVRQIQASMRRVNEEIQRQRDKIAEMQSLLKDFVIVAPAPGMIIYKKEWSGAKRKVGSTISPFDPVVATLPDLSSFISKTYVNEIDISKVKRGQKVKVTVDAFPDKSYTGEVISVANIGEQLPNTDAKVFEVVMKLNESDPILRPSMTTGNQIVTSTFPDVIYIPLECVYVTPDTIPYVYTKSGKKQIVVLGEANENQIIVEQGLEPGTMLHLTQPEESENLAYAGEELKEVVKERMRLKREEEAKLRTTNQSQRPERGMGGQQLTPEQREQMMQMMQSRGAGGQSRQGGQTQQSPGAETTGANRNVQIQR